MLSTTILKFRFLVIAGYLLLATGCDQFNSTTPPPPPPPSPPPVVATATVVPTAEMAAPVENPEPPPPPPKTDDDIVDEFFALPAAERTDEKLIELSQLERGRNRIKELDLKQSSITEKGLQALSAFPRLVVLDLTGCQITNDALRELPGCKNIDTLILANTLIDNGGLIHLASLEQLRELDLSGTSVTDAGFVSLKKLPELETLHLDNNPNLLGREFDRLVKNGAFAQLRTLTVNDTRFSLQGLDSIYKLRNLEFFSGENSGVTDGSLVNLGKCQELRVLQLGRTPVTALGMKKLNKLEVLEELNLHDCPGIADIAFNALKSNVSLRKLDVSNTSCTEAAVMLLASRYLVDTEIFFNNNIY